jgi:hypothetical protein
MKSNPKSFPTAWFRLKSPLTRIPGAKNSLFVRQKPDILVQNEQTAAD